MSRLTAQPWRSLDPDFVELIVSQAVSVDDVADEVTASVRERASAQVDDTTLDNVRLTAQVGLAQFIVEAGHPTAPVNRDLFRAHGRAQYVAGRSIEEMLDLYQLVGLAFWRRVSNAIIQAGVDVQYFSDVTEALFAYVSDLASAAGDGYVAAGAEAARDNQARRERLTSLLLTVPAPSAAAIAAAAHAAAWTVPHAAAVAVLDADLEPRLLELMPPTILVGRHGATTVAVIPAAQIDDFIRRVEPIAATHPIGLGATDDLDALDTSRQRGSQLLALGHRLRTPPAGVLTLAGNELDLILLASEEIAEGLVRSSLAPLEALPAEKRAVLLQTLEQWLARPEQPLAIAKALHIHVQTVRYRVRQLRTLLGPAVDMPENRALLAIAVRAHRLLSPVSGP